MNKENDSSYYQLRGKIRQLKSISYVFAVVEGIFHATGSDIGKKGQPQRMSG